MASEFDETEFIDRDLQAARSSAPGGALHGPGGRPPTREELDTKVGETHQRLQELKRLQEQLERERVALEEARRRRAEYQVGRDEMLQHLTRGIGLLEDAEFAARRDAEQMAKTLGELRDALVKLQTLNDQSWTQENYNVELTRALATIENARMEWNGALLKWPLLDGKPGDKPQTSAGSPLTEPDWSRLNFRQWCRIGLGLSWPLAVVALAALTVLVVILIKR